MPLYTYRNIKTGEQSVRMVPIAQRDTVPGYTRVPEFPVGRSGLAENPYTMEYGARQGLKDMENELGRDRLMKELGADNSLQGMKSIWSN